MNALTTQSTIYPGEFVITYQVSGQTRVYSVVKAADADDLQECVKQVQDRAVAGYMESAQRWEVHHGPDWKTHWKETMGKSFDDQVASVSHMVPMTWEAFQEIERTELIKVGELNYITYEHYWDMLGALPPMAWTHSGITLSEQFLMSEMLTGSYTSMYFATKDPQLLQILDLPVGTYVCVERTVDASDKSTWITYTELLEALKRPENRVKAVQAAQHQLEPEEEPQPCE